MRDGACTGQAIPGEPAQVARPALPLRKAIARYWGRAIVLALALLLWLPRLSGPIDLRWDGGVYYLLGTSLAEGHGYRIPSEPGSPEALQYPPLLPAIVALHEWGVGTTDPAVVGPWLRKSYAALFAVYALAVLALATRYLRPGLAVATATLALLHHHVVFLSDLLYTELPFAVISVLFVLVATRRAQWGRPWLSEATLFSLAAAGFLLRTAGVVLFAAWIVEALMWRRWQLAFLRIGLALIPILTWQAHISRVRATHEYLEPAYEYQRAAYQFNNVSYTENISLLNPFRPELGRISAGAITQRVANNLLALPRSVGEAVSAKADEWPLKRLDNRLFPRRIPPAALMKTSAGQHPDDISSDSPRVGLVLVPIFVLSAFTIGGMVILGARRDWLPLFVVLGSIGLICTTPWSLQFARYLTALTPFLAICFFLAWSQAYGARLSQRRDWPGTVTRAALIGLLVLTFAVQVYAALKLFYSRASKGAISVAQGVGDETRFFAHDDSWQAWEEAMNWVGAHTPPEAIVATSAPHLCYLLTNRRSVLPPMEANPARERHLLENVPISNVVVDELLALDVTRRYVLPTVEKYPDEWHVVYSNHGARVYERREVSR